MNYPNYYPNYPYPNNYPNYQSYQPTQQNPNLIWVQTEEEASNFPLGTNQSIFLMNQKEPFLYMKSVDQLGKTTFLKKRLVDESDNKDERVDLRDYIRREEIENIIVDLVQQEVERKVSEISFKPTRTKKPTIVDEE